MKNFDVVIHEYKNRNMYYDNIVKIESHNNYIVFWDKDGYTICEPREGIKNLEIIYQGNKNIRR